MGLSIGTFLIGGVCAKSPQASGCDPPRNEVMRLFDGLHVSCRCLEGA